MEIKKIRQNAGLTQQEFATSLDASITSVQKWESGERNPSKSMCKVIQSMYLDDTLGKVGYLEKQGIRVSIQEIANFIIDNQETFLKNNTFFSFFDRYVAREGKKEAIKAIQDYIKSHKE